MVLLLITRQRLRVLIGIALMIGVWREVSFHYHLLPGVWAPGRTDMRADSLLWGCIVAIALRKQELRKMLHRRLTGIVISGLLFIDIVSNLRHGQHNYSIYEPIILALLVVWPILHQGSGFARLLEHPLLRTLGYVSYSLYLWQQVWLLFPGTPVFSPKLQVFPTNLLIALLCAVCSHYFVERPFIRFGRFLTIRQGSEAIIEIVPA